MKKLILSTMILSSLASQAYAGGVIGPVKLAEIMSGSYTDDQRPTTRIKLAYPLKNVQCDNKQIIVIYSSPIGVQNQQTVYHEQQYAAALTALANDNQVSAYVHGCTSDGRYARAARLSILR